MPNHGRRSILKGVALTGAVGLLSFIPRWLLAAWPKTAFASQSFSEAVTSAYGTSEFKVSNKIAINMPARTETGSAVSIGVSTSLPQVESIGIFVEQNPIPLAANFDFSPITLPEISTRIELIESSRVYVIVKSNGRLFGASTHVKVLQGACG